MSEFHHWTWLSKLKVEDFVCRYCTFLHLGCFFPSTAAPPTPAEHSHNFSTSENAFVKGSCGVQAFHIQNFHADIFLDTECSQKSFPYYVLSVVLLWFLITV